MERRPRIAGMERYSEEHRREYNRLKEKINALHLRAETVLVNRDGSMCLRGDFDLDDLMKIIGVLQEDGWIE
jgi:hypothetical protein